MTRALFLDRDGIINVDTGYTYKTQDIVFMEGIFDICRNAQQAGYKLIVVTNQSGIGRGYYTEKDLHTVMAWMQEKLAEEQITLDKYYYCPYHPEGIGQYRRESNDRKPGAGMLLKAKQEFNILMQDSIMLGDKPADMEAAWRAGVGRKLMLPHTGYPTSPYADRILTHLREALKEFPAFA
ncbi:MAG: HAD family hydrolase [Hyphomicrobiales bacterium]|nr:HAD family hydrolase [Rickettsiales bacterium]MCP5362007.1 HAD family hydrolase [Hyphomicrobiales bacterium]